MTNPVVSIITPTYNHERYIGLCIESVLGQTFSGWEMIIVDDESTDDTESIVRQYDDPRITYIRQDHVGPYRMSETYNRALNRARGEFIGILEGDDLWPIYKLERQLRLFNDHPEAVACYGRAGIIDDHGGPVGLYPAPQIPDSMATTSDFVLHRSWLQPVTVMIRRDSLSNIGGFSQDPRLPVVDLPTWLRLSMEGAFRFHDAVFGLWRRHERQVTANYAMNPGRIEIAHDFYDGLTDEQRQQLGISEAELRSVSRRILAEDGWSAALEEMNNCRWTAARRAARSTLANGSGFRRLEATVALGCTLVHFNPTKTISTVAASAPGRRLVQRHNPLARDQRPELLAATLSVETANNSDGAIRPISKGVE